MATGVCAHPGSIVITHGRKPNNNTILRIYIRGYLQTTTTMQESEELRESDRKTVAKGVYGAMYCCGRTGCWFCGILYDIFKCCCPCLHCCIILSILIGIIAFVVWVFTAVGSAGSLTATGYSLINGTMRTIETVRTVKKKIDAISQILEEDTEKRSLLPNDFLISHKWSNALPSKQTMDRETEAALAHHAKMAKRMYYKPSVVNPYLIDKETDVCTNPYGHSTGLWPYAHSYLFGPLLLDSMNTLDFIDELIVGETNLPWDTMKFNSNMKHFYSSCRKFVQDSLNDNIIYNANTQLSGHDHKHRHGLAPLRSSDKTSLVNALSKQPYKKNKIKRLSYILDKILSSKGALKESKDLGRVFGMLNSYGISSPISVSVRQIPYWLACDSPTNNVTTCDRRRTVVHIEENGVFDTNSDNFMAHMDLYNMWSTEHENVAERDRMLADALTIERYLSRSHGPLVSSHSTSTRTGHDDDKIEHEHSRENVEDIDLTPQEELEYLRDYHQRYSIVEYGYFKKMVSRVSDLDMDAFIIESNMQLSSVIAVNRGVPTSSSTVYVKNMEYFMHLDWIVARFTVEEWRHYLQYIVYRSLLENMPNIYQALVSADVAHLPDDVELSLYDHSKPIYFVNETIIHEVADAVCLEQTRHMYPITHCRAFSTSFDMSQEHYKIAETLAHNIRSTFIKELKGGVLRHAYCALDNENTISAIAQSIEDLEIFVGSCIPFDKGADTSHGFAGASQHTLLEREQSIVADERNYIENLFNIVSDPVFRTTRSRFMSGYTHAHMRAHLPRIRIWLENSKPVQAQNSPSFWGRLRFGTSGNKETPTEESEEKCVARYEEIEEKDARLPEPVPLYEVFSDANAFSDEMYHRVVVGIGLTRPPLISPLYREQDNIARMGTSIAHELAHVTESLFFNRDTLLSNGSCVSKRVHDLVSHFASLGDRQSATGMNGRQYGKHTFYENHADVVGLNIAYALFRDKILCPDMEKARAGVCDFGNYDEMVTRLVAWVKRSEEARTKIQEFFIANSQMWCSGDPKPPKKTCGTEHISEDVHAFPQFRVNVPIAFLEKEPRTLYDIAFSCNKK